MKKLDKFFVNPDIKKAYTMKSIFYKIDLSKKEIRILTSVFAALYKKKVD